MWAADEEEVRTYIMCSYHFRFDAPDEGDWSEAVQTLVRETGCSDKTVKLVFKKCLNQDKKPAARKSGSGRPRKLSRDNKGLKAAAIALNIGLPPTMATEVCNQTNLEEYGQRFHDEKMKISRNALIDTLHSYTDVKVSAILRRKSGSKDKTSAWAKARLALCKQLVRALELGKLLDEGKIKWEDCEITPLWRDGILWCDENHIKVVLPGGSGHSSSFAGRQYRISMDQNGELKSLKDGGMMPERKQRLVAKFPEEARACYGVSVPSVNDNESGEALPKPTMMPPWDYTVTTLCSKSAYESKKKQKIASRKQAKKNPWAAFKDTTNPYRACFGDESWEEELKKDIKKDKSITDMIDHIISEGNRIFHGTAREETWMIYHDHLKILWEKETLDYLKTLKCEGSQGQFPGRTWYDRLIKLEGKYNEGISKRYQHKLPGDSPELMPLDCHLFADLREGLGRNVAYTYWLEDSVPRKYLALTPTKLYHSILRTLDAGCPSPARIEEDCFRIFDSTLERIIEAEGCYIEDSALKDRRGGRGVRGAAAAAVLEEKKAKNSIKVDAALEPLFKSMINNVLAGNQAAPYRVEVVADESDDEDEEDEIFEVEEEGNEEEAESD
jgi:hypothetical protein